MATAERRNTTHPLVLSQPDDVISFGKAGRLFTGVDAEIRQHCAAILEAYDRLMFWPGCRHRPLSIPKYNQFVEYAGARAEAAAALPAVSAAGAHSKAMVLETLAPPGIAMYAVRVLSASLADDVLKLFPAPHMATADAGSRS